MLVSGSTFLSLSMLYSTGGPRGPYNQFLKCPEWFRGALSYPDHWFRHTFR